MSIQLLQPNINQFLPICPHVPCFPWCTVRDDFSLFDTCVVRREHHSRDPFDISSKCNEVPLNDAPNCPGFFRWYHCHCLVTKMGLEHCMMCLCMSGMICTSLIPRPDSKQTRMRLLYPSPTRKDSTKVLFYKESPLVAPILTTSLTTFTRSWQYINHLLYIRQHKPNACGFRVGLSNELLYLPHEYSHDDL